MMFVQICQHKFLPVLLERGPLRPKTRAHLCQYLSRPANPDNSPGKLLSRLWATHVRLLTPNNHFLPFQIYTRSTKRSGRWSERHPRRDREVAAVQDGNRHKTWSSPRSGAAQKGGGCRTVAYFTECKRSVQCSQVTEQRKDIRRSRNIRCSFALVRTVYT
jgi:hypothetical protein